MMGCQQRTQLEQDINRVSQPLSELDPLVEMTQHSSRAECRELRGSPLIQTS